MNKMKLNYPYLKKWMGTVVNKGESFSEYDNKPPSKWDESMFSNWFLDNAVDHSNTANQFTEKIFGIPKGTKLISFFETKENAGSGFNGNKNWNRFGSIKSALYDVWAEIKRKSGSVNSESKINEYGRKPKAGVQTNYAKEIAHQTGARESAVKQWLDMNEADPLSVLQGIGSGRIKRNDFIDALMSDNGTLEFLNKYNSDGKWSSVWKATPKTEGKLPMINIQKVKRMIREAVLKETPQQNKTVKSLLDKWTNEHTTDREEYLYLLSKITEEALRDANFYHNGVLTKIPNIFRVKPAFDGSNLDKLGFKFGTTVAQKCEWVASDIIGAIEFFLRMNGYQSVADNLVKLLEE